MKHPFINLPERPAFMKIVDLKQQEINSGYILVLDKGVNEASIIILKKGGMGSMIKTEVKALEGFEPILEELNAKKVNLEAEKEVAKQEALAEVDARFAENAERIERAIAAISITVETEVPDEEEQPEQTEVVEEQPVSERLY